MKWIAVALLVIVTPAAPIFVNAIPHGYRDWKLISVAREEGNAAVPRWHRHRPAGLESGRVGAG
jgi:hypothetical protein